MKREVLFPKLSTKTDQGVITEWLKPVGSKVAIGEILYEVETEKAVHEVEALFAGQVVDVKVSIGDEVFVDDVLAVMEVEG
ncbi:biotin/lipoyl-containing protein [Enterococcus columbae]|uniref:Lipoyl-binding domain-containing protein n=1 Tax=Enterococcus columbae DSM 7374 = ATCC 51263 TaxID=1121865 RepID=S1P2S3_9ENTE|nr:biotin/lipoyl-containing protein [Enterococcus columbae]EOT43592.1 hypothetical protein OMW_00806 [Enterococcus columbae DSM 7374 = ATCC 51263]EOW87354.1 hypothetical protein I568_00398 [Enterococcus columbae DSM 7374 = ATCC 51263]OJG22256.1 hypothetical protein RR47_GL001031 [Enterococcus columbae DSM 7374 = ATCC 51263]